MDEEGLRQDFTLFLCWHMEIPDAEETTKSIPLETILLFNKQIGLFNREFLKYIRDEFGAEILREYFLTYNPSKHAGEEPFQRLYEACIAYQAKQKQNPESINKMSALAA